MFKYFWAKVTASIPVCYLTLSQADKELLHGIVYIIIIDTVLGIWVGFRYKKLNSRRMSRFFTKVGRYGLALGTVWILSTVEPTLFGWAFRYVGVFIILTELFSNFEKLALLGFKMPTDFLSRLNEDFKMFKRADEKNKKKIADDIILNGERKS